jgi:cytoskeletal protein CcmA (bactofilin family)
VKGNLQAGDRVEIRNEGSLTGDVIAQRISIEDGAFFKGGIDIQKPGSRPNGKTEEKLPTSAAAPHSSAVLA